MAIYVVTGNVKLSSGGKWLKKDKVFSETDVSEENLKRWLQKRYVRKLDDGAEDENADDTEDENADDEKGAVVPPFYMTTDYLLTPREVNKLKQNDLVKYGQHIGVPDIDSKTTVAKLKKQINDFIEKVETDEDDIVDGDDIDDEPEDGEENDGEPGGGDDDVG